jgi:hypothetical protein
MRVVGNIVEFIGILVVLGAIAIALGDILILLRTGEGVSLSVLDLLSRLGVSAPHNHQTIVGVQKLIESALQAIYGLPAWLFFFLIGGGLTFAGEKAWQIGERLNRRV